EISRCLKPRGTAVFWEPLGHNPFINWYRAMTPGARSEDERPLLMNDVDLARKIFGRVEAFSYGLTTLASVPIRNTKLAPTLFSALSRIDKLFFCSSWLSKYAWY